MQCFENSGIYSRRNLGIADEFKIRYTNSLLNLVLQHLIGNVVIELVVIYKIKLNLSKCLEQLPFNLIITVIAVYTCQNYA